MVCRSGGCTISQHPDPAPGATGGTVTPWPGSQCGDSLLKGDDVDDGADGDQRGGGALLRQVCVCCAVCKIDKIDGTIYLST